MAANLDLITREVSRNIKHIVIKFAIIDLVEKVCYMEMEVLFQS